MPALKTYDLFISHAWAYGQHYDGVVGFLETANNFYYRHYSAPGRKPVIPPGTRTVIVESAKRFTIKFARSITFW